MISQIAYGFSMFFILLSFMVFFHAFFIKKNDELNKKYAAHLSVVIMMAAIISALSGFSFEYEDSRLFSLIIFLLFAALLYGKIIFVDKKDVIFVFREGLLVVFVINIVFITLVENKASVFFILSQLCFVLWLVVSVAYYISRKIKKK